MKSIIISILTRPQNRSSLTEVIIYAWVLLFVSYSWAEVQSVEELAADSMSQAEEARAEMLLHIERGEDSKPSPHLMKTKDLEESSLKEFQPLQRNLPEPSFKYQSSLNIATRFKSGKVCTKQTCSGQAKEVPQPDPYSNPMVIVVYASFSMPDESLKSYARDLQKVGGRMVVQGLIENSFQVTQKKLMELGVELDIDPVLFEQNNIKHVPTIQVRQPSGESDLMRGHVSLEYALEEFARQGNEDAKDALESLRAG